MVWIGIQSIRYPILIDVKTKKQLKYTGMYGKLFFVSGFLDIGRPQIVNEEV